MESLRRWCAAHGKGVWLRVVKVAVKGGSYGWKGNLQFVAFVLQRDLQARRN
jgi:hypothetical protein